MMDQRQVYVLEPLIVSMQDAFIEYSDFFENDLPLQQMNTLHVSCENFILKTSLDNLLFNQEQKMKLYNYLFYKLMVSKKYNNDYYKRITSLKSLLIMILLFEPLFQGMSLCSYEEYASNKKITSKLKRKKLDSIANPKKNKGVDFKLFGYSTKNEFRLRAYSLNEAIQFYGFENVMRVLKKIQYFNLCLKQDYEYLYYRRHLFSNVYLSNVREMESCEIGTVYDNVVDGIHPSMVNKVPVVGTLEHKGYDVIASMNSKYFEKYNKILCVDEEIKQKMKKIYTKLNETIVY